MNSGEFPGNIHEKVNRNLKSLHWANSITLRKDKSGPLETQDETFQ